MEKTFSKIKTLKNRRKLSLPASPNPNAGGGGSMASLGLPRHQRRGSEDYHDSASKLVLLRHRRSLSPVEAGRQRSARARNQNTPVSSAAASATEDSSTVSEDTEELEGAGEDDQDTATDLTTTKIKAMRKSLRSRSVCNNYSLFAGLQGVNSIVAMTGSHIAGRRLSTPAASECGHADVSCQDMPRPRQKRSKRSESACTVEEEAHKLRFYMAQRHASLTTGVHDRSFLHCHQSRFYGTLRIFVQQITTKVVTLLFSVSNKNTHLPVFEIWVFRVYLRNHLNYQKSI